MFEHSSAQPGNLQLTMVGAHQRDVPLTVRERLAFGPSTIGAALTALRPVAAEAWILSTCNRVELYALLPEASAEQILREFLAARSGLAPETLQQALTYRQGEAVVRHLCRVASGLDSMVLGEDQIVVQIKQALEQAQQAEALGHMLHRLVRAALAAGKAVRTETAIGRSHMSVVSVALDLARQVLGDLASRRVLVVGAGQMAELTLKHLRGAPSPTITVANRSPERARALAQRYGAHARALAELPALLAESDVVVSCTSAPGPLIAAADVARATAGRASPLLLLDLAIPRDIAPQAGQLPGARLYSVDDLQAISAANRAQRASEIERAEQIVDGAVARFEHWRRAQQATPTIKALRDRAEAIRVAEVERMLARLPSLDDRDRQAIHALSAAIVNKLLHQPMVALKEHSSDELIDAAQRLFQLEA
jgi:glutamyl-tRNA reductase